MASQKKGAKIGRSKRNGQSLRYKNERRRERNKLRRLLRHVARYGEHDKSANKAIGICRAVL